MRIFPVLSITTVAPLIILGLAVPGKHIRVQSCDNNNCPEDNYLEKERLLVSSSMEDDPSETRLRVFFLFGQSNMQGHGCEVHLKELVNNKPVQFGKLFDDTTNDWAERDDVFIRHCGQNDAPTEDGCLGPHPLKSVGSGARADKFGPETGFGWTLGDSLPDNEDVFLCKAAWGGRDLAVDFRPPSSSKTNYNGGKKLLSEMYPNEDPAEYSVTYQQALAIFQDCILNIETYAPGYDHYDLDGIVFFQGWNDLISVEKVGEYYYNLMNLIIDVRQDLGVPDAPFVVVQVGQHTSENLNELVERGDDSSLEEWNRIMKLRRVQWKATNNSLHSNFVRTSSIVDRWDTCPTYADGTTHLSVCGCDSYHYFNNAQIMYKIGVRMATKMLKLMNLL